MDKSVKVSSIQMAMLAMGFLFGGTAVVNPAASARQDAWIADIISFAGGLALIGAYVKISKLNPGKTLIDILRHAFGKVLGSTVAVLYIWYIIHQISLALRGATGFMTNTIYPETPDMFIAIAIMLVSVYMVKKGLEAVARVSELLVPVFLVSAMTLFFTLISLYKPSNFLPVLERGFAPVAKASFTMTVFPYGESVILLMIFPHLYKKGKLTKSCFIAAAFAGFIFVMISARELMVLGPDMMTRAMNANFISAKLVPGIDIEALIATNLMIGSGIKISICLYAAAYGIAQLLGQDSHKTFVMPVAILGVVMSLWLFDSIIEKNLWQKEVYPYYALPFQIVIPAALLILSKVKKKKTIK